MAKDRILLIDSKPDDQESITAALRREGYRVYRAVNGLAGLKEFQPHLILLDQSLPDTDGLEVCRQIRRQSWVPIIILSDRDTETDKVLGLELGADDYITRPLGMRELVARVRAVLRRTVITERAVAQQNTLSYPELEIDLPTRAARVHGEQMSLTSMEFDLLYYLASQPNVVLSREDILRDVWGYAPTGADIRCVDTLISRLRTKLKEGGDVPWSLVTVWGVGYKFQPKPPLT